MVELIQKAKLLIPSTQGRKGTTTKVLMAQNSRDLLSEIINKTFRSYSVGNK